MLPTQTCFYSIRDKNIHFEIACSVKIVRLLRTCKQLRYEIKTKPRQELSLRGHQHTTSDNTYEFVIHHVIIYSYLGKSEEKSVQVTLILGS
jgi:multimeric flavodoxin WrbA